MQDLRSVAEDIKGTLASTITELRRDVQSIAARMDDIEETTALHDTASFFSLPQHPDEKQPETLEIWTTVVVTTISG